ITCQADYIENGNLLSQKFIYKEGERFSCNEGYTDVNGPDALCTENGWSTKLQCKGLQNQYMYNDVIETTCNEGFVLERPGKVSKCTKNGWDPHPVCKRKRNQYTYNDVIETTCNEGFVLEGPGRVSKCTATGWNPRPPVC
ncbi:hypothetical protein E2320_010599, partial [Naja naja]